MPLTVLRAKYQMILPHLNERQSRLLLAIDAKLSGYGGISLIHRASGVARSTIYRGIKELNQNNHLPVDRSRNFGGGRKKIELSQPGIRRALDKLVDPESRGDAESPLRWTVKSTRKLAEALISQGYKISHTKVAEILSEEGYSLQGNAKVLEGSNHEDRDAQFHYINAIAGEYTTTKNPVISVDTKKKELMAG